MVTNSSYSYEVCLKKFWSINGTQIKECAASHHYSSLQTAEDRKPQTGHVVAELMFKSITMKSVVDATVTFVQSVLPAKDHNHQIGAAVV